jgi:hypothetical protein
MRLKLIGVLLLILISTAFSYSQKEEFKVFFVQDNIKREVKFDNSVIVLEPKRFKIEVHLYNIEGVYANISFDTLYYSTPLNERFPDWKSISFKTMVEENFNIQKDVIVHPDNVSYWFYDPNLKWHRFDKDVIVKAGENIGTKTVENLYDVDKDSYTKLKQNKKPIYFTFFTADKDQKGYLNNEFERKKIKIVFKD